MELANMYSSPVTLEDPFIVSHTPGSGFLQYRFDYRTSSLTSSSSSGQDSAVNQLRSSLGPSPRLSSQASRLANTPAQQARPAYATLSVRKRVSQMSLKWPPSPKAQATTTRLSVLSRPASSCSDSSSLSCQSTASEYLKHCLAERPLNFVPIDISLVPEPLNIRSLPTPPESSSAASEHGLASARMPESDTRRPSCHHRALFRKSTSDQQASVQLFRSLSATNKEAELDVSRRPSGEGAFYSAKSSLCSEPSSPPDAGTGWGPEAPAEWTMLEGEIMRLLEPTGPSKTSSCETFGDPTVKVAGRHQLIPPPLANRAPPVPQDEDEESLSAKLHGPSRKFSLSRALKRSASNAFRGRKNRPKKQKSSQRGNKR